MSLGENGERVWLQHGSEAAAPCSSGASVVMSSYGVCMRLGFAPELSKASAVLPKAHASSLCQVSEVNYFLFSCCLTLAIWGF